MRIRDTAVDDRGRLKVDDRLRVEGHENIYALGDIAGTDDPNLAYVAKEQAKFLYTNMTGSAAGNEPTAWEQSK